MSGLSILNMNKKFEKYNESNRNSIFNYYLTTSSNAFSLPSARLAGSNEFLNAIFCWKTIQSNKFFSPMPSLCLNTTF